MKITQAHVITILGIIGFIMFGIVFTDYDFNKISTRIYNVSIVFIIHFVYSKYWLGNENNTDKKIYETANATAIYHGLLFLGIALAISLP